jgi:hypothetical protein
MQLLILFLAPIVSGVLDKQCSAIANQATQHMDSLLQSFSVSDTTEEVESAQQLHRSYVQDVERVYSAAITKLSLVRCEGSFLRKLELKLENVTFLLAKISQRRILHIRTTRLVKAVLDLYNQRTESVSEKAIEIIETKRALCSEHASVRNFLDRVEGFNEAFAWIEEKMV